jgi:hypothetical protein
MRRGKWMAVLVAVMIWALFASASASAISAPIHIAGTGGEGVFIRPDPNTSRPAIGWMPEGASPDYHCFVWGQNINGVPIWFNVTYNGVTGYYASYFDDSSYHSNEELTAKYGVPLCGSSPPPTPAPSSPPSAPEAAPAPSGASGPVFNRSTAVKWARANARDNPPHPASCTWFVSLALWAGGLPQTSEWTSSGSHGRLQKRPGTVAAWAVPEFVNYILRKYPRSTFTQLNLRGNRVPAAQPGDVIAYDWYGHSSTRNRTNLEHLSLVTSIERGQYPEVSEWSIFDGIEPTPYVSRGWTWSAKTRQWLQEKYPQVQAFLLHIDTGT